MIEDLSLSMSVDRLSTYLIVWMLQPEIEEEVLEDIRIKLEAHKQSINEVEWSPVKHLGNI